MRKSRMFRILLVLVMAVSLLAACGSGDKEPADSGQDTDEKNKIGVFVPLTGEQQQYGEMIANAIRLRVDEYNTANGTNFVVEVFDDKGDPKEAVNVANLICSDPAMICGMGSYASSCVLAAAPVFEEAGLLLFSPGASHVDVPSAGKYIFTYAMQITTECREMSRAISSCTDNAPLGIIYQNTDHGILTNDAVVEAYPTFGGEVVASETFVPGDTKDFKPLISKLNEAGAKNVFISSGYSDAAQIVLQAADLGLSFQFFSNAQVMQDSFVEIVGDKAEGMISTSSMPVYLQSTLDNEAAYNSLGENEKAFVENFKAQSGGKNPDTNAVLGYDATTVLLEMIAAVGTDSDALVEALPQYLQQTEGLLCGKVTEYNDKVLARQVGLYQLQDGAFVKYSV